MVPPSQGVVAAYPGRRRGLRRARDPLRERLVPHVRVSLARRPFSGACGLLDGVNLCAQTGLSVQTSRSNPRSLLMAECPAQTRTLVGVKASGRRTTFRSSTRGEDGGGAPTVLRPSRATGRSLDRPQWRETAGLSAPGGKDAEKRETTPPRATCVGYPARRPAEPSGSLPNRRPSRDPPRTPGSRRASSGPTTSRASPA